ncbi:MAG TPA: ABC-F family ATP-binding cassette domain-containing protein [Dissulfurispiraceae bacterium]|nr:ABC-F family ATP-binding cassette domain-containing protein [Dissulfurispiraceae bacterium]
MIQAYNLSKSYGRQTIFDEVGFTVNTGERIGLVGRNGHGKTTLFRMLLGEERPDSGTISIPSGYAIGHLSQHIRFTQKTVLAEACLSLPLRDDGVDETYRAEKVLTGLGFADDDFRRSPLELSGGFQIRLNLAKVLLQEPNLLLLDEPTNYLDILSIRWLKEVLRAWKNELMLITHDRAFMDSVSTHTMGIHRCTLRKMEGSTEKFWQQIAMDEEVHERTRVNDEKKRQDIEQFINRFRAQATRAKAVQSKIKALQRHERLDKLQNIRTLEFQFNEEPFVGKWLLETKNLNFSYNASGPQLIENLSFIVGPKDRVAIIGPNGKGKTTLLSLLAGELTPSHGEVVLSSKCKLGYFGQTNINRLSHAMTVEEEIMSVVPDELRRTARAISGVMMFDGDAALKKISVLSGGERSRVLLGKLLAQPSNLLLLDEPTNHLDMESVDSLLEAIDAFEGAVIIVAHSEMILHALATRLIVFDGGGVRVFEGTYQDFLERVGWLNEKELFSEQKKASSDDKITRKNLRKLRADVITDRSRILVPLQNRMEQLESLIVHLEEQCGIAEKILVAASEKGDWQTIGEQSKILSDAKSEIEKLFDELAGLAETVEMKSREFAKRLSETGSVV